MKKNTITYHCGLCNHPMYMDVPDFQPKYSLRTIVNVSANPSQMAAMWKGEIVQININAAGISYHILSEYARIVEYVAEEKISL